MRGRLLIPVLLFAAPLLASAPQAPKAAAIDTAPAVPLPAKGMHRYMVTRTFPAGALAGLDAAGKKAVNRCQLPAWRALGLLLRQRRQDEDLLHL